MYEGSGDSNGHFQNVNRRRAPRKTNFGKNTTEVNIEGAEAAPYEVFVGNTHPKATEAIIADALTKCALTLPDKPDLKIIHVKCLTNLDRDPHPRTKCWRIQVPYWHERSALQSVAVRRSTGNDVSGLLFSPLFIFPIFFPIPFSAATFSHRRSAQIKKLFSKSSSEFPIEYSKFLSRPRWPFCGPLAAILLRLVRPYRR